MHYITTIAEPGLTCAPGSVLLLLCEDEPGEGHAVGVHGLPARHADAECDAGNNKAVEKLTHNVCRVHRVASEPVSIISIYFLRRASPALPSLATDLGWGLA